MSSKISDPLPNKSGNPSDKPRTTTYSRTSESKEKGKIKYFNLCRKSSHSVNDFFERKQMIEYFEAEMTGSLTKIGLSLELICGSAHQLSQG